MLDAAIGPVLGRAVMLRSISVYLKVWKGKALDLQGNDDREIARTEVLTLQSRPGSNSRYRAVDP